MTQRRTDFVMFSRAAWEDVMIDDLEGLTCKLLLTLVLEANYKDAKLVYSERPFAAFHKWDRDVLRRHMQILEEKGYVRPHKAKNQYTTGYVEVLKYDLLVRGAGPGAGPGAGTAEPPAQPVDQQEPETTDGGKTQDVVVPVSPDSCYPQSTAKTAVVAGESELLKGSIEERKAKAKAALDEQIARTEVGVPETSTEQVEEGR